MPTIAEFNTPEHNHEHTCPLCSTTLTLLEDTIRPKLSCPNTDCRIDTCYCNGTIKESTVNRDTLHTYIKEHYTEPPTTIIDSIQNNTINDPFAENLIELLQKRDLSTFKQAKDTGERVIQTGDVYIPWSQLLRYTITTTDDETTLQTALKPIENNKTYTQTEVEQFVGLL